MTVVPVGVALLPRVEVEIIHRLRLQAHHTSSVNNHHIMDGSCVCVCVNMRAITFSFVDQSLSRGMEKFGENIPTIPEVIGAHTLNFKPNFKFS